jgi:hypothetical protein
VTFKIVSQEERRTTFHHSVQLDLSRDTAILIRQSRKGSHVAHYESRLLQESLIPFVMQARGESDLTHIRIFDEGSGVSGTKGPDKRKKVRMLLEDIVSGLIGDLVLARADRLFRDKHFNNVSTFTTLAEKMKIKVIVPTSQGIIVYDLTKTKDLQVFQQDMQASYAYVENQIGYMNRARDYKMSRGLYGGGCLPLPYVLLKDMPKEEQVPVIYRPWLEPARDLFEKFQEFNFESGRMLRYVEGKPYIFPYMPTEDLEIYKPVTNLKKVEKGYTFATAQALFHYLGSLVLGGYAYGGRDRETGEIILIADAFDAAIPMDLLEQCYAAITGYYLDGTPFIQNGGTRQYRRQGAETDAMLHGLLTSDDGSTSVYALLDYKYPIYTALKGGYLGQRAMVGLGRVQKAWALPCPALDNIILSRLIALAEYDKDMVERIRQYFDTVGKEGESTLAVLDTAIQETDAALKEMSQTLVLLLKPEHAKEEKRALKPNDPLIKAHRELQATLRNLEKQREEAAKLAKEDPTQSVTDFYHVLSHLRSEFNSKSPQTKKDIIRRLIEEVKVNAISPHLYTVHITWISPVSSRDDVALLWRSDPRNNKVKNVWTEEEETALKRLYPDSPQIELLKAMPTKTPGQIKNRASKLGVRRPRWSVIESERFYWTVAYADLEAAAKFTETLEERVMLWREINRMAESTKRGQLTATWFLPVDVVSFPHALDVTSEHPNTALLGYR